MIEKYQTARSRTDGEETGRVTLDCYLSSIATMAECVEAACPGLGSQTSDQLASIRKRLAFQNGVRSVTEARDSLEHALASWAEQARRHYDGIARDLGEVAKALAEPEGAVASRIEDIRNRLAAETLPNVDPLTGLIRRRELERQIMLRLADSKQFCVLLFDVDDFARFNETFGNEAGDQVLTQIAERLKVQIRGRDIVARWVADEFIVLMECDIETARRRSIQMARHLGGLYTIDQEDAQVKQSVQVLSAAAACVPGDTPRQIWMRLEEDFQRQNDSEAVA